MRRLFFYAAILTLIHYRFVNGIETVSILERKTKRPPHSQFGGPLDVQIGFYLESLGRFNSEEMSFDADLYLYMSWRDPTLKHNRTDHVMINDMAIRNELWLPDIYFSNARSARFHDVTVPNFNMFIAQDGTIAYSNRVTLTVSCHLKLENYPMDHQHCSINVLSYAYVEQQVKIRWFTESAFRYNSEISLPEFTINAIACGYCNGTYTYALMKNSNKTGHFSCLTGTIHLARNIGYNMVQSFIPTTLIVVISWVSFWIDRRAVPAVTVYVSAYHWSVMRKRSIYGCMLFVFCALLEFALVNHKMRKAEKFEKFADQVEKCEMRRPSAQPVPNLAENGGGDAGIWKLTPSKRNAAVGQTLMDKNTGEVRYEPNQEPFRDAHSGSKDRSLSPVPEFLGNFQANDNNIKRRYSALQLVEEGVLNGMSGQERFLRQKSQKYSRFAHRIDEISRIVFPGIFLVWNIGYWWYYMLYDVPGAVV